MLEPSTRGLEHHIAQVGRVPLIDLSDAAAELTRRDPGFKSEYVGFNDGGWHSAVLWNPSGKADDRILGDGLGQPTPVAESFPAAQRLLQSVIDDLSLRVSWARLARMKSGARVWEHRDFLELAEPDKIRLHVPLITSPAARLHFSHASVHLATGWIWRLNGDAVHAASNDGPDRTHLIIDCLPTQPLRDRLRAAALDPAWVTDKPPLSDVTLSELAVSFERDAAAGNLARAERTVLDAFGRYDLGTTNTFRIAAELCRRVGRPDRAAHWQREELDKLVKRQA